MRQIFNVGEPIDDASFLHQQVDEFVIVDIAVDPFESPVLHQGGSPGRLGCHKLLKQRLDMRGVDNVH